MKTAQQIAGELSPGIQENNAAIGFTNPRRVLIGNGEGLTQPPVLLGPRDVYYRSAVDQNDRGTAILSSKCPIPIQSIWGYYNTEVWIGGIPGPSKEEYIYDIADENLRSTGGPTPVEGLVNNAAMPSQDRLMIFRLRIPLSPGLSLNIDVGVYSIAYQIPGGGYGFAASSSIDLSDPTNIAIFSPAGVALTAGEHCIVGIALNPVTGGYIAIQGTPITASGTLPSRSEFDTSDYSAITFTSLIPCGYAYMYFGQTTFVEDDCLRIYDPRLFARAMISSGDVSGPGSAVDHTVARFDGTTGKLIEDTGVVVDDSDNMTIPGILTTQSGKVIKERVVTASGAVTVTAADDLVTINKTVGAATTANLPASPATGQTHIIHDGKGDAATNNITITPAAGNINGASTLIINANYGTAICTYNGTQWDAQVASGGGLFYQTIQGNGTPTTQEPIANFKDTATVAWNITNVGGTTQIQATASGGGGGGAGDYILIQDQKSSGTNGGVFNSGAWRTRDLTTIVADPGGHASLASNQITLAAGTYRFLGSAPAYYINRHQLRLMDITNTIEYDGTSEYSDQSNNGWQTRSFIEGRFTITGPTVFEMQHRCQTTYSATTAFGVASGWTTEVYSTIHFVKE